MEHWGKKMSIWEDSCETEYNTVMLWELQDKGNISQG